ncbi:hypothetical protein IscW_ISCW009156 [Ixodes scapularis]|uniref:ZSWIM3 N-terminal domain-containing protein n=1 Tax=Ixodes scapularis TaxID=6945 RepID=B7PYG6_IXOSC|nr:hypothetical protein IscW_ISCW009156 [Ixodes scapularis]|eukprot:XP_002403069.1 hypothetical protein IscW_ISCW009156 [Ixodes scapularis]
MAAAADVTTFFIGEEFTSFTELHRRIQSFQLRNSVQLYIRSSRKIQAAQVRSTDGYNPELKFAEIYYACVRGGRKFQSRGNSSSSSNARHYGRTEVSNSRQINCPFHIKIRCTRDGQKLYIKDFNSSHNHGTTEQDAVLSRSRTRHYWPQGVRQAAAASPPPNTSQAAPRTKAAPLVTTTTGSLVSKDGSRQVSFPILPEQFVPKDPAPPATLLIQPNVGHGLADGGPKDEQTESLDCDSFLEPECILQYDDDKCYVPSEGVKAGGGDNKSGMVLQALKAVLNGDRKVVADESCRDGAQAAMGDRFVVKRSDVEEMTRFCNKCGAKVSERRSQDQKDGSLLVKFVCSEGHNIEWRFERLVS